MIELEVVKQGEWVEGDGATAVDHFIVRGDEPWRIEIIHRAGTVSAHIYRGAETDIEQEPLGCYDGTLPENTDWRDPDFRDDTAYLVECGCCEQYHRHDFEGDCRNDAERFPSPEEAMRALGVSAWVQVYGDGSFSPPEEAT
jgi:hypothetical protein